MGSSLRRWGWKPPDDGLVCVLLDWRLHPAKPWQCWGWSCPWWYTGLEAVGRRWEAFPQRHHCDSLLRWFFPALRAPRGPHSHRLLWLLEGARWLAVLGWLHLFSSFPLTSLLCFWHFLLASLSCLLFSSSLTILSEGLPSRFSFSSLCLSPSASSWNWPLLLYSSLPAAAVTKLEDPRWKSEPCESGGVLTPALLDSPRLGRCSGCHQDSTAAAHPSWRGTVGCSALLRLSLLPKDPACQARDLPKDPLLSGGQLLRWM